jgi:hypothetical protein
MSQAIDRRLAHAEGLGLICATLVPGRASSTTCLRVCTGYLLGIASSSRGAGGFQRCGSTKPGQIMASVKPRMAHLDWSVSSGVSPAHGGQWLAICLRGSRPEPHASNRRVRLSCMSGFPRDSAFARQQPGAGGFAGTQAGEPQAGTQGHTWRCGFCGSSEPPIGTVLGAVPGNWNVLVCKDCRAVLAGAPMSSGT